MKSCGWKLTYICQQLLHNDTYIHLGYPKSNPKLYLSLIDHHPLLSTFLPISSLSLSLWTCPPWIAIMFNIRGCYSLPRSVARGTLGTVPIWLSATLFILRQIVSGYSSHFILPPSVFPYLNIYIPQIFMSPFPTPSPLLHSLLKSLGYPERYFPTMSVRVSFLDSAPLQDTILW